MGRTSKAKDRAEEPLARAHAFAEKLLAENARLRRMLAEAHVSPGARAPSPPADERVRELERELADARARLASVPSAGGPKAHDAEALERDLAETKRRLAELEEQNNNLANLYVASYQLHSTLDFKEVIAIVMEIVVNLVGAEVFCILLKDGVSGDLTVIAAEGMPRRPVDRIPLGEGILGTAAKTGEPYYRPAQEKGEADFFHPLAAIPLKIKDHVIGVIAVNGLFPQKHGFSPVDYELFNLLAGHAATAIFSSKLYSESERRLGAIQSFLDLLTKS